VPISRLTRALRPKLIPATSATILPPRVPERQIPIHPASKQLSRDRDVAHGPREVGRRGPNTGSYRMLRWAIFFLVISLVAALFGFTGISAAAAGIAKILFFIFIVLFVIFLIVALMAGRAIL
jgi:uncharacterized membrane protein YtjA (UPF0391 family)